MDEADREALEHLSGLAGETKELLKGATALEICVLFCDTHHQVANGKDRDACRQYGNDIRSLALTYDLSFVFLSDSYTAGVPCTSNIASHLEHIGDPALREKTQTLFRQEAFRKKATDASAKHSQLVKRGTSAEVAARLYTLIELDFLTQLQRPERVFASYSDPAIQRPIAEATPVPMLYLHSSGPGHHACPWYVAKS
ncbi:MAG: hypothetical protein Q7S65_02980 [Nanoarchaeota archaeon]|nr:hypothetical protein [Nanoarchaeota archaeon]